MAIARRARRPANPSGKERVSEQVGVGRPLGSFAANVPNLLSALRLLASPVLLLLAWNGATASFATLFGFGLVTDVLDGVIARRLAQETELGARLDQWADFSIWLAFPIGAWWLWPDVVLREAFYVSLALVCLLLPSAVAFVKYREVPGYHTWSAKLSAVLMGIGVPLLLIFDVSWPFRLAVFVLIVAAVDELGITAASAKCRHDVPSVFHVLSSPRPR